MHRLALASMTLLLGATAPGDERVVMVTGFDRLRVDGPFQVDVIPGPPGVTITGPGAAIDAVKAQVEAGTLVVNAGLQSWESAGGKIASAARIRVSVPALRGVRANGAMLNIATLAGDRLDLSLNGAGRIDIGRVDALDLNVTSVGAGTIALKGGAQHLRVRLYGSSVLDGAAFTAGDAVLVSGSSGELAVNVRYMTQVAATSSGAVRVLGTSAKCVVTGTAPVECAQIDRREKVD